MCGIAGIFHFKSKRGVELSRLNAQVHSIAHRGPDHAGHFCEDYVGLGATRLSIIDLPKGTQPQTTPDGRYTIVFNGEIYNYQELRNELEQKGVVFQTNSDTEVVLQLFATRRSPESVLRGMFAYAVYDRQEKTLTLSRDRLGKKPLFFANTQDGLVFGSEIKTLLASGEINPQPNVNAISDFLSLGYVPGPQTGFLGVEEVPPGTRLIVKDKIFRERYWKVPTCPENSKNKRDWAALVADKLSESVRYRMVSDVPVGLFLSGGIDSNLILLKMLENKPSYKIKTYTLGFHSHSYDERNLAAQSAAYYGVENKQLELRPEFIENNFSEIVRSSDNLLANPACYGNFLLAQEAAKDLKVVLNGGGGDELFFGYPTYQADTIATLASRFPGGFLRLLSRLARLLPASHKKLSFSYKAQKFLEGVQSPSKHSHYAWRSILSDDEKNNLLLGSNHESYWSYENAYQQYEGTDLFEQYSYADLLVWWTYMGLYQADAMSMANSIELRVPMMDHEFIELVYQIPRREKFKGWRLKPLFQKSFANQIPSEILHGKKKGFHIPLAEWFCGPLKNLVADKLSEKNMERLDFINYNAVRTIRDDHFNKKFDNSFKINNLMVLVEWYQQFIENQNFKPISPVGG